MNDSPGGWKQRVLKTIATTGEGLNALTEATNQHWQYVRGCETKLKDDEKIRTLILEAARTYFNDVSLNEIAASRKFERMVALVQKRRIDPYTAAQALVERE